MAASLGLWCRASRKRAAHQQRSYTIDTKFWGDPGVANFKVRGANYLKVSALAPHSALHPGSLLPAPSLPAPEAVNAARLFIGCFC